MSEAKFTPGPPVLSDRQWRGRGIGRLIGRFESALGVAWCTDQRESATRASLDRDWGRADKARDDLILAAAEWEKALLLIAETGERAAGIARDALAFAEGQQP
ncbi:MAG TPA: hypothetical protein VFW46_15655 [Stellaceae bacterium]|nr:hypothetical protein [Stellaceae bacterium]